MITSSDHPLQTFWVLWSVKESAYKAWQRHSGSKPVFNPLAFNIIHFQVCDKGLRSSVKLRDFSVDVKTKITSEYIYSYCDVPSIANEIVPFDDRCRILEKLEERQWILCKSASNIPELQHTKSKEKKQISFSHDGRFTAYYY